MSYRALSIKLSRCASFCLRERKWHRRVFKYIWTPAGNCYRVEKERRKRLAQSKRLWFFSVLLPHRAGWIRRLTCSFHFQGVNLQLKAGYHYIKNITEPTRARNLILQVLCPPVAHACHWLRHNHGLTQSRSHHWRSGWKFPFVNFVLYMVHFTHIEPTSPSLQADS